MTRVGAVHGALGPRGGGLRGGGGRGDDGAQAHRQALLHLQVGARIELQTKVHTKGLLLVKVLLGDFNREMTLVGAFSVFV